MIVQVQLLEIISKFWYYIQNTIQNCINDPTDFNTGNFELGAVILKMFSAEPTWHFTHTHTPNPLPSPMHETACIFCGLASHLTSARTKQFDSYGIFINTIKKFGVHNFTPVPLHLGRPKLLMKFCLTPSQMNSWWALSSFTTAVQKKQCQFRCYYQSESIKLPSESLATDLSSNCSSDKVDDSFLKPVFMNNNVKRAYES